MHKKFVLLSLIWFIGLSANDFKYDFNNRETQGNSLLSRTDTRTGTKITMTLKELFNRSDRVNNKPFYESDNGVTLTIIGMFCATSAFIFYVGAKYLGKDEKNNDDKEKSEE